MKNSPFLIEFEDFVYREGYYFKINVFEESMPIPEDGVVLPSYTVHVHEDQFKAYVEREGLLNHTWETFQDGEVIQKEAPIIFEEFTGLYEHTEAFFKAFQKYVRNEVLNYDKVRSLEKLERGYDDLRKENALLSGQLALQNLENKILMVHLQELNYKYNELNLNRHAS